MFKLVVGIIFISLVQQSCSDNPNHDKQLSIEGVYVTHTNNEFSLTWDTIQISVVSKKAGTYLINHKAGYQRIRNGKILDKEYKETALIGNWYKEGRQLKTEKLGRVYSFPEGSKELLLGTVPYTKIH